MAARRLSDSEKQELVGRYKAGESTAALAETFGCSPNTVSRTVKALLPPEAYAALKASRQKGGTVAVAAQPLLEIPPLDVPSSVDAASAESATPETSAEELSADESSSLALDDAADFAEASDDQGSALEELVPMDVFTELVPLIGVAGLSGSAPMETQPLSPGVLPDSVYMLVDKVVELDARPLRDFPELGPLDTVDQDRQGLFLFANPRAAKRQCGRSQRVIKVPDTTVFERTSSYLLKRGITRLVMEGTVVALDA
ncbi:MAG: helix-turn-helix domain-containing protein [Parasynechococcus sp.]|jgi:transposase-like protein|uniref:helix-turn-helix domain-containing protein n=1 Tax=Parasynechococcus sp. TaxID=3101203 RepID=UPI000E131FCE|nr:helix-turn-helix domain-containing protein [Synechococcus sp. AH-601-J22]RCL56682.1 MAG: helix-turn-helix domain-containing protein [Synechococcus sp. MED-G69]|tara:strand:+ start:134 stop:904 length:771 start_codon:yes stop_codon:yes gene_type:complete